MGIKDLINKIKSSVWFEITLIVSVIGGAWFAIDYVAKKVLGKTVILAFILLWLSKAQSYMTTAIIVQRWLVSIPIAFIILYGIYAIIKLAKGRKIKYKYIRIKHDKGEDVVRFAVTRGDKENASGRVLCGRCRIPFDFLSGYPESYVCRSCSRQYGTWDYKHIRELARSKWIKGGR